MGMHSKLSFSVEVINGDRLGCLAIPFLQVADWINFLASPHYGAQVISAEQKGDSIHLYFQGGDGLYGYLDMRINTNAKMSPEASLSALALAS